jgi:hypothetical protein
LNRRLQRRGARFDRGHLCRLHLHAAPSGEVSLDLGRLGAGTELAGTQAGFDLGGFLLADFRSTKDHKRGDWRDSSDICLVQGGMTQDH